MPGAAGEAPASARGGSVSSNPSRASILLRGSPPGRSKKAVASRQATTVDSIPTCVGPPSMRRSIRPSRSASTWAALVGERRPDRLAEGATTGPANAARISRATGWSGIGAQAVDGLGRKRDEPAFGERARCGGGRRSIGPHHPRGDIDAHGHAPVENPDLEQKSREIQSRPGPWTKAAVGPRLGSADLL